jgi:site-specific DNA recombinase
MNIKEVMEKAILYTRVSTDEQAERGYSLADQKDKLQRYCKDNSLEALVHYQEDYSAKTFDRPEFKKLLSYIKQHKGEVKFLIFHKWDRFSRNATDAYMMIRELNKLNVTPRAIEQPLDLSIPENKMMLAFYLTAPEIENDRRSMNVTNGMRRAMKQGRWVAFAPKGYLNKRDEDNRPIIVPGSQADFIKKAFSELAKGIKPAEHIRRELAKEGFSCSRNNFNRLIRNPIYCGKIRIDAKDKEEEDIVEGIHSPLISEELFYQVQNILSGRAAKMNPAKIHKVSEKFPLRGFLVCPRCGSKLTASASKGNGGKYFYYHCVRGCKERIKAEELNLAMTKLLQHYTFKPEIKDLFKEVVMDSIKGSSQDTQAKLQHIQLEIEKTRQRLESLQDKFIDNEIGKEDYNMLKSKYNTDIERLIAQRSDISLMTKNITLQLEFCMDILENLSGFYEKTDVVGKQRIIGSIFTGNLIYSEKKVRTTKVNEVVSLLINTSKAFEKMKKGQFNKKIKLSHQVTPAGFKPTTFRTGI